MFGEDFRQTARDKRANGFASRNRRREEQEKNQEKETRQLHELEFELRADSKGSAPRWGAAYCRAAYSVRRFLLLSRCSGILLSYGTPD